MKNVFLFPGQGAQTVGMGKDFYESYPIAKHTFEEADDLLKMHLSKICFEGPVGTLTETRNSQAGIYVTSIAILRVIQELFPNLLPEICSGLSLGEYTAATAAGYFSFQKGLELVSFRGQYMNDACEENPGTMAVVLGADGEAIEKMVKDIPGLWAANFNCPGQVVISGRVPSIDIGSEKALQMGAKRVLPLQVHGAFHSGLMESAQNRLKQHFDELELAKPTCKLVMNVTGEFASDVKENLINQVTSSVRWEKGIEAIEEAAPSMYLEMGPGKTLAGFNKRIGVKAVTRSVENIEDLKKLEEFL